jgi:hypothetical protein
MSCPRIAPGIVSLGLACLVSSADAAVLCSAKNGTLRIRQESCKPKESRVDPVALGLVGPQGPAGPAGPQGPSGPSGLPGEDAAGDTDARLDALETKTASMSVEAAGRTVRFTGVNVQVVSGSGATDGAVNGLGNLIVGYDEVLPAPGEFDDPCAYGANRGGSHNVVLGAGHDYTGSGGLLTGQAHRLVEAGGAAVGGRCNVAGSGAVTIGGSRSAAIGARSVVVGGWSHGGPINDPPPVPMGAYGVHSVIIGGEVGYVEEDGAVLIGGSFETCEDPLLACVISAPE